MANSVTNEISCEELKALMGKSKDLILVDVRTKGEVDQGHISGYVNIPVDTVQEALKSDPESFKAKYGVSKPSLDAPDLVFYCQMGRRGGIATDQAYKLGYVNARNLTGGYKLWSDKEKK